MQVSVWSGRNHHNPDRVITFIELVSVLHFSVSPVPRCGMVTEDTITLIFISNGKSLQTTQTQESRWRRGCVTTGVELLQDFQADTAKLTGNPGGWQSRDCREPIF